MPDIDVLDAAVHWNLQWMNPPTLSFLVPAGEERYEPLMDYQAAWHRFSLDGECRPCRSADRLLEVQGKGTGADPASCDRCHGTRQERHGVLYLLHQAPLTTFFTENTFSGGGMSGRTLTTVDGDTITTNGGWSSGEGTVNELRLTDERMASLLPEPVVGVTYHRGGWDALGMAGICWDLSFVQEQLDCYLPTVELLSQRRAADLFASADQSLISAALLDIRDDEKGTYHTPYPVDARRRIVAGELTRSGKPFDHSDLYKETEHTLKYRAARSVADMRRMETRR